MKKFCVYIHTCPNGKVYIGKTCREPYDRWGFNGCKYYTSPHFYNAIQKYGWDNITHKVLCINLTEYEACELEKDLISLYKSNDNRFGYNLTEGGDGSPGRKHTDEWKQFMSERMSGEQNSFYGKHHSEKQKEKWKKERKGKQMSGENPIAKAIYQLDKDTGEIINKYDSIADALRAMGKKPNNSGITQCCKGKVKSIYGFVWMYVDDYNIKNNTI